jgi:hypothetical protein
MLTVVTAVSPIPAHKSTKIKTELRENVSVKQLTNHSVFFSESLFKVTVFLMDGIVFSSLFQSCF